MVDNRNDMYLDWDEDHVDLYRKRLFPDKDSLINAIRKVHIATDRNYVVTKSNKSKLAVKCTETETPEIPIKTILPLVINEYNHQVNYKKEWRGKQIAIEEVYGSWATTYESLPIFFATILTANPGTAVEIDDVPHSEERGTSVCNCIFWCLKAMMDGWKYARPVISIDGTFLKGKYLLLWRHVCQQRVGVCIISDRAASIISAMKDRNNGFVEPLGIHIFCLFHVRSNFSLRYPGSELRKFMWKAGSTTQIWKHDACMKSIGEISPPALEYLRRIPAEKWTLCYNTNGYRFGQTTTNIMEGFNGNIRRAHFLPVTAMMEYLFYKTVRILDTHRNIIEDSMQRGEELCSRSSAMLSKIETKATAHMVTTYSRMQAMFSVRTQQYMHKGGVKGGNTQVGKLRERSCTCRKWATHHMPCSHAVAGCMKNSIQWKHLSESCHYNQEQQKLYMPLIYPLQPTEYWNYQLPLKWKIYGKLVVDESLKRKKKKHGEKGQSVRIRTEMDASHTANKCSACHQEGHIKRRKKCPLRPPTQI
ncbi:uncharacterized protein LOC141700696 [Apium graveolens]|uniref:uncharacterized protein LOC141700696 n=1 Tax=Apium graveolens TaxID=4045 RepID=UPI003D7A0207